MSKRKGKLQNNLGRGRYKNPGTYLILIVVEGQKTEYKYFESMKKELKLDTAKIEIVSASGGDPLKVVEKANDLYNKQKNKRYNKPNFEKVFCVFDYDNKPDKYEAAIKAAKDYEFEPPIISVPCFEFWYLLHYRYSDRPFQDCDEATKEVEKELQKQGVIKSGENYQKKLELYDFLRPQLEGAIANAEKLIKRQEQEQDRFPNPQTKVHILVKYLQGQKKSIPPNY